MKPAGGVRVLMLLENGPYPEDARVGPEAVALTQAGHRVAVIAPAAPGQPWHEVVNRVTVYRYPPAPEIGGALGFVLEYGYSLVASSILSMVAFLRHGFDVVHAHNPPDLFVFVAAFYKLFGKRFVFDQHDLAPEMYRAKFGPRSSKVIHRILISLERLSCRMADHVIAPNESYAAVQQRRSGVPRERISVVRNGPDLDSLRPVEPALDLPKGRAIICYVGIMESQDGVDCLMRSLRYLVNDLRRTDFLCVLVGSGGALPELRALVTRFGLEPYVRFTGFLPREEFLHYLSAAQICVEPVPSNPYTDRSTTIKIMEYMTLAKPIVAFDLPEHRVTAGEAACYVEPNDEREFARALARLLDDPKLREKMGALGRRRVESELAWPHSVPPLLNAYRSLLAGRAASASATGNGEPPPSSDRDPVPSRSRKLAQWLGLRGPRYIAQRSMTLVRRYGITASRAKKRALDCVETLARHDCRPTFPTPGQVVGRNRAFFQELQRLGVEVAIHGYHHQDFRALSAAEARSQFARAEAAYEHSEIQFEGFRCPYLSYTEALNGALPSERFLYSSNRALWWDVAPRHANGNGAPSVSDALSRFYQAEPAEQHLAVPRISGRLVEIPVCLPDDLQLLDGLGLDEDGVRRAWIRILRRTHRRGELFDLMFHPESFERCGRPLEAVLREARALQPHVWITQLRDINRWWREKTGFAVEQTHVRHGLRLRFHASARATVLIRNLDVREPSRPWRGSYRLLEGRTLRLSRGKRPFIGIAAGAPAGLVALLRDQGYIVDGGPEAPSCAIYLGAGEWSRFENEVQLIRSIETSAAPMVRFWRWPSGARSSLCITGDLDALSLMDYAARAFSA